MSKVKLKYNLVMRVNGRVKFEEEVMHDRLPERRKLMECLARSRKYDECEIIETLLTKQPVPVLSKTDLDDITRARRLGVTYVQLGKKYFMSSATLANNYNKLKTA